MKLPPEVKNQYAEEILCNRSLQDLPEEEWKLIENFENYAISNYGRVKSLERLTFSFDKIKGRQEPERILKLTLSKQSNNYLQSNSYKANCRLSSKGKNYGRSVARLVYYHFIEKFDLYDRNILICCKDDNSLHIHYTNLEKISASENRVKTFHLNRARNRNIIYEQPVSKYTVEGVWVADFESMYDAEKSIGVGCRNIMDAVNKQFLTAGQFRWFLKSYKPKEEDFIIPPKPTSKKILNTTLWKRLDKPSIDKNNPPPCLNLSLENFPNEQWKPIPGFEGRFVVSNKGRIKRLSGWTPDGRKLFLKEQILSQIMNINSSRSYSLYCVLRHKRMDTKINIAKMLYYCFVEEFDLNDKTIVIANNNDPLWDIELSKLSLRSIYDVLKGKQTMISLKKV